MVITYDKEADAAYIDFDIKAEGKIFTSGGDYYAVDIDESGEAVGIEVTGASKIFHPDYLAKMVRIDKEGRNDTFKFKGEI